MKRNWVLAILSLIIIAIGVYFALTGPSSSWKNTLKNYLNFTTTPQKTTIKDISSYTIVPQNFTWIEENNSQFGISFKRPSFWTFKDEAANNGRDYSASFIRPTIVNAPDIPEQQKYELRNALLVSVSKNYSTPEQYLDIYAPTTTQGNFQKKIGDKDVITSYIPNVGARYTFFTEDKIITFSSYYTSDAERAVIEQIITSFKIQGVNFITPANLKNYPVEQ